MTLKIEPLAAESLGVRSLSVFVETPDIKILIDPGASLGRRFSKLPHKAEYYALAHAKEKIIEKAKQASILSISHYHFDHYTPSYKDWLWNWCSPEIAEKVYNEKNILAKDNREKINYSQRKRAYFIWKMENCEILVADENEFKFGRTSVKFSPPFWHGPEKTKLGWVLLTTVKVGGDTFLHAPDVQGPIVDETLEYILDEKPDILVLGGPPTYLKGFRIKEEDLRKGIENIGKLAESIPLILLDHHLLRSSGWKEEIKLFEIPKEHSIKCFAEYLENEVTLLEANRRLLYDEEPMPSHWHENLKKTGPNFLFGSQ